MRLFNCLNKQIYTNCNGSFNLKNSVNLYMSFNSEVQIEKIIIIIIIIIKGVE
jgi:hypothetical protein